MKSTHYKDAQRINRWLILFIAVASLVRLLYRWKGISDSPDLSAIIIETIALVLINALLIMIRLTIEIKDSTLFYKFFPFHWRMKTIDVSEMESASLEKFNPLYWGLGLRYDVFRNTKGYIVSGTTGLKIVLKGGKKILFSTSNAQHFVELIQLSK